MKKVLILSINPKWTELILSGKKTVEIRKQPIPVGTLVMMYETKNGGGKGKIVGSFVVKNILNNDDVYYNEHAKIFEKSLGSNYNSCMIIDDLWRYSKGNSLYGIVISQLNVFEKPKELKEFYSVSKYDFYNNYIDVISDLGLSYYANNFAEITNPPQSKTWAYMEEME